MVARQSKPQLWRTNIKPEQAHGQSNQAADQSKSFGSHNHNYELKLQDSTGSTGWTGTRGLYQSESE